MSQFSTPPHDQAHGLRSLAQPATGGAASEPVKMSSSAVAHPKNSTPTLEKNVVQSSKLLHVQDKIDHAPYVVLISETPSLQGVLPLALHLVKQVSQSKSRALLVDLTPAASRMTDAISSNFHRFRDWADQVQPLWTPSLHGRTLHAWKPSQRSVDVLAQLATEFPTAEQMPRICEQLVRQLGQQRALGVESESMQYGTVILLSEFVGVPLDSAAWQAADEIWLFHDVASKPEQIRAGLNARLSPLSRGQRIVLLSKQPPTLRHWAARRRVERLDVGLDVHARHWNGMERFQIAWPQVPARLARSLSGTARELVQHLMDASHPRSTRQAS